MFDYVSGPVTRLTRMVAAEGLADAGNPSPKSARWAIEGARTMGAEDFCALMLSIMREKDLRPACLAAAVDEEKAAPVLMSFLHEVMTVRDTIEAGANPVIPQD